jgi:hypothetical protein
LTNFFYWIGNKHSIQYLKLPLTNEYYIDGQIRFAFNTATEYEKLYRLLVHFRNCMIVVDEADAIFTNRKFEKTLFDVFLGSRNNNVSMIFIGKRPYLIPKFIRSQADTYTVFCMEENNDVSYIEDRVKQNLPKPLYKLERGESIVFRSGEKPCIQIHDKFIGE